MALDIAAVLRRHPRDATELLAVLWDIQRGIGHIPVEAARAVADWLGTTAEDVLQTATFYHFFHTEPTGKYRIYLSDNAIARNRGYLPVLEALEAQTGTRFGASDSAEFSLFDTPCIGVSDHEPAMLIDDVVFCDLTPDAVADIIAALRRGRSPAEIANPAGLPDDDMAFIDALVPTAVHTRGPVYFDHPDTDHAAAIGAALALPPEDVIATITESRLRGRGGAGFPTGQKWQLCRAAAGDRKYVICNADEGEPGTFKDRVLLTRCPKMVFAGMRIAAHAIGAGAGILYLRAEYGYLRAYLERQLADMRAAGLLGEGFDVGITMGAGAYICGDESALIESCEGKRGTPRLKPPFPADHGYLGRPTCVNNVETFAAASAIMEHGAPWFAAMGTAESTGTRLLSVAGDCAAPGIYEVEWGVTLRDVLTMVGAHDARAVQISGPSGEMVSADIDGARTIGYEDISCNGSFMVFDAQRDLLDVVRQFTQFFVDESCGICVPCRVGNVLLRQKIDLVIDGNADRTDLDDLVSWGDVIARTSRCGLGATSPNPILSTLRKFPEIYAERLRTPEEGLLPSFDVDAALDGYHRAMAELGAQETT